MACTYCPDAKAVILKQGATTPYLHERGFWLSQLSVRVSFMAWLYPVALSSF